MTCYRMKIDPSEPPEIPEESLTCDICGQRFDTVESLEEHKLSEVKDVELKDKGVDY
jgi:tRNA U54 and U55 pseudouridine synthase Pus10